MPLEDFTTYTKVDPNFHIGLVGTNHVDFNAYRNEDAYLYKDKGVNHFSGDFEHKIDVKAVSSSTAYGNPQVWALANLVDDYVGIDVANGDELCVLIYASSATVFQLYLRELYVGTEYTSAYYQVTAGTMYYLTIKRAGTALTCKVYSDSARTILLATLSLTLHGTVSFRYVYASQTYNDGGAYIMDCDVENLDLQEATYVSKGLSSVYNILGQIIQIFTSKYFLKTLITKLQISKCSILKLVSKIFSSLYSLIGRITRAFSIKHNIGLIVIKTLIGLYSSIARLSKVFSIKFNLLNRITKIFLSIFNIRILVPKLIGIKYSTKVSISRILSSKFGIGTIISRILSIIYSFIGFNIVSVTADPIKVIRTGAETTQLRCDWHDEADLASSYYKCEFWVRDETSNIYGPYNGTVTKEASKEYNATYDLDPTETFLLGYYDIKAEVTKYG